MTVRRENLQMNRSLCRLLILFRDLFNIFFPKTFIVFVMQALLHRAQRKGENFRKLEKTPKQLRLRRIPFSRLDARDVKDQTCGWLWSESLRRAGVLSQLESDSMKVQLDRYLQKPTQRRWPRKRRIFRCCFTNDRLFSCKFHWSFAPNHRANSFAPDAPRQILSSHRPAPRMSMQNVSICNAIFAFGKTKLLCPN